MQQLHSSVVIVTTRASWMLFFHLFEYMIKSYPLSIDPGMIWQTWNRRKIELFVFFVMSCASSGEHVVMDSELIFVHGHFNLVK